MASRDPFGPERDPLVPLPDEEEEEKKSFWERLRESLGEYGEDVADIGRNFVRDPVGELRVAGEVAKDVGGGFMRGLTDAVHGTRMGIGELADYAGLEAGGDYADRVREEREITRDFFGGDDAAAVAGRFTGEIGQFFIPGRALAAGGRLLQAGRTAQMGGRAGQALDRGARLVDIAEDVLKGRRSARYAAELIPDAAVSASIAAGERDASLTAFVADQFGDNDPEEDPILSRAGRFAQKLDAMGMPGRVLGDVLFDMVAGGTVMAAGDAAVPLTRESVRKFGEMAESIDFGDEAGFAMTPGRLPERTPPELEPAWPESARKYVFNANVEGGQTAGNEMVVAPVTEELYDELALWRVMDGSPKWEEAEPLLRDSWVGAVRDQGEGEWRVMRLRNSPDEIADFSQDWVKQVPAFDAPEALRHRYTSDTGGPLVPEAGPAFVPGEIETNMPGKWSSRAMAAIQEVQGDEMTGQQWLNRLKRAKRGVADDELREIGALQFLQRNENEPVTRAALVDAIEPPTIREVVRGVAETEPVGTEFLPGWNAPASYLWVEHRGINQNEPGYITPGTVLDDIRADDEFHDILRAEGYEDELANEDWGWILGDILRLPPLDWDTEVLPNLLNQSDEVANDILRDVLGYDQPRRFAGVLQALDQASRDPRWPYPDVNPADFAAQVWDAALVNRYDRFTPLGAAEKTKWSRYTLKGGENYAEIVMGADPLRAVDVPPDVMAAVGRVMRGLDEGEDITTMSVDDRMHAATYFSSRGETERLYDVTLTDQEADEYYALQEKKDAYLQGDGPPLTEAEQARMGTLDELLFDYYPSYGRSAASFISSHWPEENIVVHLRMDEREVLDAGERAVNLIEIQSDWHQAARKQGQLSPFDEALRIREARRAYQPKIDEARRRADSIEKELNRLRERKRAGADIPHQQISRQAQMLETALKDVEDKVRYQTWRLEFDDEAVPMGPYAETSTWAALGVRRAIAHAMDRGLDWVVIPTGTQAQTALGQSTNLKALEYEPNGRVLRGFDGDGEEIFTEDLVSPERLEELIGPATAKRILADAEALADPKPLHAELKPHMFELFTQKWPNGKTEYRLMTRSERTGPQPQMTVDGDDTFDRVVGRRHFVEDGETPPEFQELYDELLDDIATGEWGSVMLGATPSQRRHHLELRVPGEEPITMGTVSGAYDEPTLNLAYRRFGVDAKMPTVRREGENIFVEDQGLNEFYNRTLRNVAKKEAKRLKAEWKAVEVADNQIEDGPGKPSNFAIRLTDESRKRIAEEGLRLQAPPEIGAALMGAYLGGATGETPEERAQNAVAGLLAGMAGGRLARGGGFGGREGQLLTPGGRATASASQAGAARSQFFPAVAAQDGKFQRQFNLMVETVVAPAADDIAARLLKAPTLETRSLDGQALDQGTAHPSRILVLDDGDEVLEDWAKATRLRLAIRGILTGSDGQVGFRLNPEGETRGFVFEGPDEKPLSVAQLREVRDRLGAEGGSGVFMPKDGFAVVIDHADEGFTESGFRALLDDLDFGVNIVESNFDVEVLDGAADFWRAIGPDAQVADELVGVLEDQVLPVYREAARRINLPDDAVAGLEARVEEIRALADQIKNPPPVGTRGPLTTLEAMKQGVSKRFRKLTTSNQSRRVRTMADRAEELIDEFLEEAGVTPEIARDWYREGAETARRVLSTIQPELRSDPQHVIQTVISSILSNGQQVGDEVRGARLVYENWLKNGEFTMLKPGARRGRVQALTEEGKPQTYRTIEGETIEELGDAFGGSPRSYLHETQLRMLQHLSDEVGGDPEQLATLLLSFRTLRGGRRLPVLEEVFGPKIGQYASDKLGVFGEDKATVDLWGARLYWMLRGMEQPTKVTDKGKTVLDDSVTPAMREELNRVFQRVSENRDIPMSAVQAETWYAIKLAFQKAGAAEKRAAYATLPSAATDAIFSPRRSPSRLEQGRPKKGEVISEDEGFGRTGGTASAISNRDLTTVEPNRFGLQTPPEIGGALAGAAIGGMVDDEDPARGAALGLLAGIAGGAGSRKLGKAAKTKQKPPVDPDAPGSAVNASPEEADAVRETMTRERALQELAEADDRIPFEGEIDTDEFVNVAKFALDPSGEKVLREEVERVVRQRGLAPKEKITWGETIARARSVGLDLEDLDKKAAGKITRPEMIAMEAIIGQNARAIARATAELREGMANGTLSLTRKQSLEAVIDGAARQNDVLIGKFTQARSEAGRALNALKIVANWDMDPANWLIRMRRAYGQELPDELRDQVYELINAGDKVGLAQLLRDNRQADLLEKFQTLRKAGLLTGLRTHEANILGNTSMLALETVKDVPAYVADRIISVFTGVRTKAAPSRRVMEASLQGAREGMDQAKRIMRGELTMDDLSKYDQYKEVNFDNAFLDAYTKTIFRSLSGADAFFKQVTLHRSLLNQAEVRAANRGFTGDEMIEEARRILDDPSDEMVLRAIHDSEIATFTNRGVLAKGASSLKQAFSSQSSSGAKIAEAVLDWFLPFRTTPANVAERILEYGGVGLPVSALDILRAGGMPPDVQLKLVERIGRTSIGMPIIAGGAWLYLNGKMTGAYPEDYRTRQNWKITGKRPNSVLWDGRWRSVERLSPFGNMLALGANLSQAIEGGADAGTFATYVGSMMKNLSEQSYLQGVNELTSLADDPIRTGLRTVNSGAGSLIPTLAANVARGIDPTSYQQDSPLDAIRSRIPGAARLNIPGVIEPLQPRLDPFGEERQVGAGGIGAVIDPFYSSTDRTALDAARRAVAESGIGPSDPSRLRQYENESDEDFRRRQKQYGQITRRAVEVAMQSAEYRNAERAARQFIEQSPDAGPEDFDRVLEQIRRQILEREITRARTAFSRAVREER